MSRKFLSGGTKKGKSKGGISKVALGKMMRSGNMDMKQLIEQKSSHQVRSHDEMLEDLIDEKMFSTDPRKNAFHQPGTKKAEERVMTKGMIAAMEMAKQKRAKQRDKGSRRGISIKPVSFGSGENGGRLTADGKIMDFSGKILFTIDKQSGMITDGFGKKVGKYKPGSVVNDVKLEQLFNKARKSQSKFNPFAGPDDGRFNPFGAKE